VIVSRADASLVQRLFEMEVPEIYDGTVQIRHAAREAGERTKVAVASRDKDVDPVGACVGMKGMRVQSIIRELRGEKIDIIPFSEETVAFAQKALSPAKVTRVQITDPENRKLEVIVEDSQLSLAIGKKGQNVRLASKLIGWDIDIKSEEEKRREIEEQMTALQDHRKDRGGWHYQRGETRRHDPRAVDGDSGHRREDGRQDLSVGESILRRWRDCCDGINRNSGRGG
jgi:N utilization substance protein A